MIRFHNIFLDMAYFAYRWFKPVFDPLAAARALPAYPRYARNCVRYGWIPHAERRRLRDTSPVLGDAPSTTPVAIEKPDYAGSLSHFTMVAAS